MPIRHSPSDPAPPPPAVVARLRWGGTRAPPDRHRQSVEPHLVPRREAAGGRQRDRPGPRHGREGAALALVARVPPVAAAPEGRLMRGGLAVGAHPGDIELGCWGALAALRAAG